MENYTVWSPENDETEDDAATVEALDAEDAAATWGRLWDEGDWEYPEYHVASGNDEPIVHVRAPDGTLSRWRVEGEWDPIYSASEVDEGEGDDR